MKQRMYILVARSLSPIQKGIQALHAVVEYENQYGDTPEYKRWAEHDKTVILLDGGTTNETLLPDGTHKGSLNNYLAEAIANEIPVGSFVEEDVNDALSAVAMLADERVWDRVTYPDYDFTTYKDEPNLQQTFFWQWSYRIGVKQMFLRDFLGKLRLAN
jgi:hypothetical protein